MGAALDRFTAERDRELETAQSVIDRAEEADRDVSDAEQEIIRAAHDRVKKLDEEIIPPLMEQERAMAVHYDRADRGKVRQAAPDEREVQRGEIVEGPAYQNIGGLFRDQLIRQFPQQIGQYLDRAQIETANQRLDAASALIVDRAITNTLSTDVAGLLPKDYQTFFAELIDAARPIVDSAGIKVPLKRGSVTYPSITTRPSAAKQTAEKTDAGSTKMAVAFVDVAADTYLASGDLSWQSVNWSDPDALNLWFELASEQWARQVEAAAGTVVGAATVIAGTVTVATAGLAEWTAAIAAAAAAIYTAGRRRANTVYADVTTGYKIAGLVGNVTPLFLPQNNSFSIRTGVGSIAGLELVISPGLAASTVVVADNRALLVSETPGSPVQLRAVEPSIAGVEVGVVGGFVAKITDASGMRKLTLA